MLDRMVHVTMLILTKVWLIAEASKGHNLENREERVEIIRSFAKPIVDRFQSELQTFHFFFDPVGHLHLRLRAEDRFVTETIKPYVEDLLTRTDMRSRGVSRPLKIARDYNEERDYGQGWELAMKIFEMGSRSAILTSEAQTATTLGREFNETKFVHLLLNQWGYGPEEEASFYFKKTVEILALDRFFSAWDRVRPVLSGQFLEEMQTSFEEQLADAIKRKVSRKSNKSENPLQ